MAQPSETAFATAGADRVANPSARLRYIVSPGLVELPAGNRTAIYHRQLGGLCLLDDAAVRVLHQFDTPQQIERDLLASLANTPREELLQELMLRKLIVPSAPDVEPQAPHPRQRSGGKVNIIQLILANSCNFGCTYCFEGLQGGDTRGRSASHDIKVIQKQRETRLSEVAVNRGDSMYSSKERLEHQYDPHNRLMLAADAVTYMHKALEIAKSSGAREAMVQFFGGEPLLNWAAIKQVLETFGVGTTAGIHLHYSIVTNGSLVTEEIAEAFARHRVAVCVSFDSPTSKNRPLKNGGDSTPVVTAGLRKLQKFQNYVAINVALTSSNWSEFDTSIVDFAAEYGASEIGVVLDFDPTFYRTHSAAEIVDKLYPTIRTGRERGIAVTGYWHQIFQVLQDYDSIAVRGFKNCSAKGAQLSIEPNGSVFSCKAGSGLYGSVLDGPALLQSKIYKQHNALRHENPSFCSGCEIEGFCAGICLGPLEKKFATINAVEIASCDLYRAITRKLIGDLLPGEVATFDLTEAERNFAADMSNAPHAMRPQETLSP